MQPEQARKIVEGIVLSDFVEDARTYISYYGVDIDRERGGVPRELVAVQGVLHTTASSPWELPPQDAAALGVWSGVPAKIAFWAGCRVLNEASLAVQGVAPGLEPRAHWTGVCLVVSLGSTAVVALSSLAGSIAAIPGYLQTSDPPRIGSLSPGVIVYRGLMAPVYVAAAEVLAGHPLGVEDPVLLPAPDDRVRKRLATATAALWGAAQVASLLEVGGVWGKIVSKVTRLS